jgi:hypothetical protein
MPLDAHALATAMQTALPQAWTEFKGGTFPGDPDDRDQKVLFLAIARGLLIHLQSQQNDMISTMQLSIGGNPPVTNTVSAVNLKITT